MFQQADFARDQRIGGGAYREVFAYDETSVLKIDKFQFPGRTAANARELARWERESVTPNRQYLAAILEATDGDNPWILMERVKGTLADYVWQRYGGGETPEYDYDFPSMPEGLNAPNDYGWHWFSALPEIQPLLRAARDMGLYDMHPWNIGWRSDDSFVIIDYAD